MQNRRTVYYICIMHLTFLLASSLSLGTEWKETNHLVHLLQKRAAGECWFNVCHMQELVHECYNGAKCDFDWQSCTRRCTCKPGFTGEKCQTLSTDSGDNDNALTTTRVSSTTPSPTLRPHGPCINLCNTHEDIHECYNGAECLFNATTCTHSCNCTVNYTGPTCSQRLLEETAQTTTVSVTTTATTKDSNKVASYTGLGTKTQPKLVILLLLTALPILNMGIEQPWFLS